jgi:hypothetical protein
VTLANSIRAVRDDARAKLVRLSNYYSQSRTLWQMIEDDVKGGRAFTSNNDITGVVADQSAIVPNITKYIDDYLKPAVFQQLVTTFEAFYFDLLALWLTAHPGNLYRKTVDLETVLSAPDKGEVLRLVIERELNEVKYKRVAEWFEYQKRLVNAPVLSTDETDALAELKAGRDILVHASGVVNAVYVAKSGSRARYAIGDYLELPDPYLRGCFDLLEKVTADTADAILLKA